MSLRLTGLEPILIVQIVSETTTVNLAKQELSPDELATFVNVSTGISYDLVETLRNQTVYAGISSIGSYSLSNREEGFGSVGVISASFMDFTGIFKQLIENMNIYDLEVNVYLLIRQNTPGIASFQDECRLILRGKFQSPIEWSEDSRQFTAAIVSNVIFREFGYAPEFDEIDHIRENMVADPWPHMFGQVDNFGLKPFCNVPTASLSIDYFFLRNMPIRYGPGGVVVPGGFPGYLNTGTENFVNGSQPFVGVNCDNSVAMPQADSNPDLYCNIDINNGKVLCRGFFIASLFQITAWNIPWYTNICVWGPPQYNTAETNTNDDVAYLPNTMEMLGYGTFTIPAPEELGGNPNWHFNVYDQLTDVPVVTTPFPIPDAESGWGSNKNTPWVQGMYVHFYAIRIYQDFDTQELDVQLVTLWARVVKQEVFTLYLDNIVTENDNDFPLSGFRPIYIIEVLENKAFETGSTLLRDRALIQVQKSQTHPEVFLDRGAIDPGLAGWKDLAFKIPKGSKIQVINWWGSQMYPITLDTVTQVNAVYAQVGRSLIQLDERSQFAFMKFVKAGTDHWYWWQPDFAAWVVAPMAPGGPLPYELQGWPIIYDTIDPDYDYWPEEFLFVILYTGSFNQMLMAYSGDDQVRLRIGTLNPYNTDEKVFKFLLEKYTDGYIGNINPNPTKANEIGFGISDNNDAGVTGFLATLATENIKAVRINNMEVNMVDLLELAPTIAFTFTEKYIDERSIVITYTETQDIKNIFKATGSWTFGTYSLKNKESIARHSELKQDLTYSYNRLRSNFDATISPGVDPGDPTNAGWTNPIGYETYYPRGYNRALAYWLWRKANTWMQVSFTTYLEAAHLVPGDIVELALTQPLTFNDPSKLGVLRFPIGGSGSLPNCVGLVTEVVLNPDTWTVSISILTKIRLGEG